MGYVIILLWHSLSLPYNYFAPLKNKDGFIHSDSSSKVEILNDQFVSAYTREDKSNIPRKGTSHPPTMDSIREHCNGVLKLLRDPKILKDTQSNMP